MTDYLFDFPNVSGGYDSALTETVSTVPSLIPWFLFFIFGVVFLSGILNQKRRLGFIDAPFWAITASICTLVVTLPMTLIEGIIQIQVLAIVVAVTLACGVWFFMDKGRFDTS